MAAKRRSVLGQALISGMLRLCLKALPANWLVPRWRAAPGETVIASHGSVEIRLVPAGCVAQTCVKGDAAQARETAMRRLAKYTHGYNRTDAVLGTAGPIVQQQQAPGRWLIRVRLTETAEALAAPAPCIPKVKLVSCETETLAVVKVAGRPVHDSIAGGNTIILTAVNDTDWIATGSPMIRLHARGPLTWFARSFEVAVPVAARCTSTVH